MSDAAALFARTRGEVAPALARAVARLAPSVRRVVEYHLGSVDATGRPVRAGGGKAVRATLALLSARAAGAPPPTGVPGAVAVELIHNFSLLHDDVMDEDRERRHRPTAWVVFGIGAAICAGDGLLTLAEQTLLQEETPEGRRALAALQSATQELIAGQMSDLAFEGRFDVSVREYLEMAQGKTGALLGCAASIGARLAGAPAPLCDGLDAFGRALGLAFQAIDDVLGIWGAPERTGKPVGSDLLQSKATLPVVTALEAGGDGAEELRALLQRGVRHEAEVERATQLIESKGGREAAAAEAERQRAAALACLERLPLESVSRDELRRVAHFVTQREF